MELKAMIIPAAGVGFAAGAVLGLISLFPLCGMSCCMFAIAGGFLATYLYGKKRKGVEATEGIVCGGIAGFVQGVMNSIMNYVFQLLFGMLGSGLALAQGQGPVQALGGFAGTAIGGALGMVLFGLIGSFITAGFGALGGVIYSLTMGKK